MPGARSTRTAGKGTTAPAVEIKKAIEIFVRGFCFTRSRTHPYLAEQADLSRLLGSSSRAAEVLAGKRDLSKAMIRALVEEWELDAATLIGARAAA